MGSRFLILMRHGAAGADGRLSSEGEQQARLAGERLRGVPLAAIHHSPKPRAAATAQIVAGCLHDVPAVSSDLLDDYIPSDPDPAGLPPSFARLIGAYSPQERALGAELARTAVSRFGCPGTADTDTHQLLVTHNFLIGWFVRDALGADDWRWLGLNQQNAAFTVILYRPEVPPALVGFNDAAHLTGPLRWTGFPAELRPATC